MERLHTLDAEFLYLEDASSAMHIAGLCIFEGPLPSRAAITQLYGAKLAQFPRYRQRVRALPLELGRPVWLDDPHFDLGYHLRWTALPSPGDEGALRTLMGRLMSQLLDRERPLWESWIVEGLADGRWALISKVHHAMVDGVSGTGLLTALLDERPDAPMPFAPEWRPQAEPSRATLLAAAFQDLRRDNDAWRRRLLGELRNPAKAGRAAVDLGVGVARLLGRVRAAPDVSLQGPIGPHRSYAFASARLEDLQLIRKVFGGTVNDVVLAVLSGAYRALLEHHGDDVTRAPIRSLVPVSVRNAARQAALDNQVAALLCELPVHLSDPLDRLRFVATQMSELKHSHMAEASAFLAGLGDLAPPLLVGSISRLIARIMHSLPQRSFSTVTTHVPGPRNPLYFLGRKLLSYYPYVPITQGTRLGTAILTYDGQVGYGVSADPEHVPDLDLFTRTIAADTAELVQRARALLPLEPALSPAG
jgi:diacylglycerol O-acyltransferase / wax synthase